MASIEMNNPDLLVGVGGWAYLPIKQGNKLDVCSKIYDFVEVNSTFYAMPEIDRVKKWRKTTPNDFEFTLRANRELTHQNHLKPTQKTFKIFERMVAISDELRGSILHFQFPESLQITKELIRDWSGFFGSVYSRRESGSRRGLKYAIEIRGKIEESASAELANLIRSYDLIHSADASRHGNLSTSPDSRILYTRVFGPGDHTKWTFDSEELSQIKDKVSTTSARRRYVTFHNLTMYEDASRMKTLVRKGKDESQPLYAPLGLDSLKRVLASGRMRFPATKQSLVDEFGWRTFNSEQERRVHVSDELERLSEKESFGSVEDVIDALR